MAKIKVKCDNCGGIIEKWPFEIEKYNHHFCDRACFGNWMHERPEDKTPNYKGGKVKVNCDNCGKGIEKVRAVAKNNKHNFCNRKCEGKWQSREQDKKIEVKCDVCGTVIKRAPARVTRSKHHFCNEDCRNKWMTNFMRELKREQKLRPTRPELIFEAICKKHNLPFRYAGDGQLWIGKDRTLNPDFVECNGKKICVEIFGDYWHSPFLNKKIRETGLLDFRKKHYKRFKWTPIFIWERDLKREDAEVFVLNKLKKEKAI